MFTVLFHFPRENVAQMECGPGVTAQANQLLKQTIPFLCMVHDDNKGYKKEK